MIKTKLGKYRIEQWIGGGAFADVFLAFDTITEKRYALKISRQRQKDIEMMIHEAKLLASLEHPNIVRFYSADIIDGRLVIVMEFVDGQSLRQVIESEAPMTPEEAIPIIVKVLDALEYAHSHGVIHRDIKPENILISKDGEVKMTDFGLAAFFKGEHASLSVAGTPIYMAPETWRGEFRRESDIWSVGAVLYEMLAGRPPFFDDTLDGLRAKLKRGRIKPIPKVDSQLMSIIRKALDKRPKQRFANASEFRAALLKAISGREFVIFTAKELRRRESPILAGLSDEQREAVVKGDGVFLVLGGAGTGKTTTLAHRIAFVIKEKGVPPDRIAAVTFTGKAAAEMRERVARLIGEGATKSLWIGTLHSFGLKILARGAPRIGLPDDFMVISRDDTLSIVMRVAGIMRVESAKALANGIGKAKANLLSPNELREKAQSSWEKRVASVYERYEDYKLERGLVDYDDLIYLAVKILQEYDDILDLFASKFQHVIVDEFQDINFAQYELLRLIVATPPKSNFFVTGDDDQSIYGFRGASSAFLLKLREDFPEMRELRLTRNFRSPKQILDLAETLISHNRSRIPKILVAVRPESSEDAVIFYAARDEMDEARYVASRIIEAHESGIPFEDMAVIMRINAHSRPFEDVFARKSIPFNILGAGGFYDREEIRAALAYLHALVGERDRHSLALILRKFMKFNRKEISLALRNFPKTGRPTFSKKLPKEKLELLKRFWELLNEKGTELEILSVSDALEELFELTGYRKELESAESGAKLIERENIDELLGIASTFGRGEIRKFLSHVALTRELGSQVQSMGGVQIMSAHSAKGLEFPIVFLVEMCEGVFPLYRALASESDLEEERRLCFVAMTRAQEKLYITYPKLRFHRRQEPSRFIYEMHLRGDVV